MGWRVYHEGVDPEHDKIVRRRFGPKFARPCKRPTVIECAMPECQYANECQADEARLKR